jgi:hypothetical protein
MADKNNCRSAATRSQHFSIVIFWAAKKWRQWKNIMEDETTVQNQNLMLVSTPEPLWAIPLFIHSFSVALNIQELFKFLSHCTINCTASQL